MGGRGSSSGKASASGAGSTKNGKFGFGVTQNGESYISADKALFEGDTLEITRQYDTRLRGVNWQKASALNATSDGNGNITLNYANAVDYTERNSKTTDMRYEVKTGFTISGRGEVKSTGIDFDNVKEISGRTYGIGDLVKQHGFKWDRDKKVWRK